MNKTWTCTFIQSVTFKDVENEPVHFKKPVAQHKVAAQISTMCSNSSFLYEGEPIHSHSSKTSPSAFVANDFI